MRNWEKNAENPVASQPNTQKEKGTKRLCDPEAFSVFDHQGKDPTDQADEDGAEESPPETGHMKTSHQAGHQPEHEGIDHQEE